MESPAAAARHARRGASNNDDNDKIPLPGSPLPFIISILPSLLSPSFVFLPPAVLSHPVHLRYHFLRPSPDSPGYLQATNDQVIQSAVEGRRERLISGRWAEEGGLSSSAEDSIEWNAVLKEEEGVRARITLGELPEERLALLLVWEDPKRVSMPAAAAAANNAVEEEQEPGWRFYDLQLPVSKEMWYPSLQEALLAAGSDVKQNGNGPLMGKSSKAKRKKPQTPQDTGLQGEEGADPDPDDYWGGCSSSAGQGGSGSGRSSRNGMRTYDNMNENEDSYWSSYGQPDKHGPGSIDDDGREQEEDNAEVMRNDPFEYERTATHSRKQSTAAAVAFPSMLQRNVSFMPEPDQSFLSEGAEEAPQPKDPSLQGYDPVVAVPNRAMSFMDEQGGPGGSAYADSAPGGEAAPYYHQPARPASEFCFEQEGYSRDDENNNDDDYDAESSYNYRGFYEYQEPGLTNNIDSQSRSSSPTRGLMNGVSDRLEASQREAALKSAIRGVWGLYQMGMASSRKVGQIGTSAGLGRSRSKTVTAKDPRIEQYEFLELVRAVVEGVDGD